MFVETTAETGSLRIHGDGVGIVISLIKREQGALCQDGGTRSTTSSVKSVRPAPYRTS